MFADSLLDTSWAQYSRQSWTTLTSFGLQAVAIGSLLLISLLGGVGIPMARTVSTPVVMGRSNPGPAPRAQGARSTGVRLVPYSGRIMEPRSIPTGISTDSGPATEPASGGCDQNCLASLPIGDPNGAPLVISGPRVVPVPPPAAVTKVFRTSTFLQGMLIHKVEPVYPSMAKIAHVQGAVILAAIVSKDGTMEHLQLMSGHPLLVPAAMDAVSRWRYRPYILNGEAIEVETQITVNFILGN